MENRLKWLAFATVAFFVTIALFKYSSFGASTLWGVSEQGHWLLPLVAVAALIDSVNPCAFSILLLTVAFLLSIGKLRSNVLQIGSAYIAGLFVVYLLIGLGLLQTLHIFDTPHFMANVGAVLLVALGLINIVNEFVPAFPVKLAIPHGAHKKMAVLMERGSIPAAVALGGLVGVCEFPCTGGPYLMVLGLLHDQATRTAGLGYLFLYNLLFILPLVIILFVAGDKALLEKVETWKKRNTRAMRFWGGNAMIILGVIVFLI